MPDGRRFLSPLLFSVDRLRRRIMRMLSKSVGSVGAGAGHIRRVARAWLVLLVIGSLQPVRPQRLWWLHREIHWIAFAGAAFLLFSLTRNTRQLFHRGAATLILGLILEALQHLLYHKTMEWVDLVDDALAIAAAFTFYRVAAKLSLVGSRRGALVKPAP